MAVLKSLNWDERCQLKIAKKRPYFSRNVTQRFFYFEIMFMAVYGCFKISQTVKGVAKITVRLAFSRFVVFFFQSFQATSKIIFGCLKISQAVIDVTKVTIRVSFTPSVSQIVCIFRSHSRKSLAF